MGTAKLKKPLFVNGNYNRTGTRMRFILDREISDGTDTYRLWRSAGKPEIIYPGTDNDRYLLYVEIGEFLAPLRLTDFQLIDRCGYPEMMKNLYGSPECREQFYSKLREKPDAYSLVASAVAKEKEQINLIGADPAVQADYIKKEIQNHIEIYEKAKGYDGAFPPDFIGALALNELDECVTLSEKHRERLEVQRKEEMKRRCDENQKLYQNLTQKADAALNKAIETIQQGGVMKNTNLTIYCKETNSCQDCCITIYLFEKYDINLPARTKGWINSKLVSVSFFDGKVSSLQYRKENQAKCSKSIWKYLNRLCVTVKEKQQQEV